MQLFFHQASQACQSKEGSESTRYPIQINTQSTSKHHVKEESGVWSTRRGIGKMRAVWTGPPPVFWTPASFLHAFYLCGSKHTYVCMYTHTHTHTTPTILIPWACVHAQPLDRVQLFATPWAVARQTSLSMEFSRQEYWSELPFPSPWDLPWLRDWTHVFCVSCLGRWNLYHWVTWEAPYSLYSPPLLTSTTNFPDPSHPH